MILLFLNKKVFRFIPKKQSLKKVLTFILSDSIDEKRCIFAEILENKPMGASGGMAYATDLKSVSLQEIEGSNPSSPSFLKIVTEEYFSLFEKEVLCESCFQYSFVCLSLGV